MQENTSLQWYCPLSLSARAEREKSQFAATHASRYKGDHGKGYTDMKASIRKVILSAVVTLLLFAPCAAVLAAERPVSGTLVFEGLLHTAAPQHVLFKFTPVDGGDPVLRTAAVGADGAFHVTAPEDNYCLSIHIAKYLTSVVPVCSLSAPVSGLKAFVRVGDINSDNVVDIQDLDLLLSVFNTLNQHADLNGDRIVNGVDLCLLLDNFGLAGEEVAKVSGRIEFEGIAPDAAAQIVTFGYYPSNGGSPLFSHVPVRPGGAFTICAPSGNTFQWITAKKYLSTVVPKVSQQHILLRVGDVNGDNQVELADLSALLAALGSQPGDPNWNPSADLNGDGIVNDRDRHLLANNFGAVGDMLSVVSGHVTFEDIVSTAGVQTVNFTFRSVDNARAAYAIPIEADGAFRMLVPKGEYRLHTKASRYLATNIGVPADGPVSGLKILLRAGDANNDNSVDVLDLDVLIRTFDTCLGDAKFLPCADFNGDDCADVLDLDLLIRNFDHQGDS
jgi:hypothetical protein